MPRKTTGLPKKLNQRISGQVCNYREVARRRGVPCPLTVAEWRTILLASDGYCQLCGEYFGFDKLYLDHIYPISMGGAHAASNVRPLCLICNQGKAHKLPNGIKPKRKNIGSESIWLENRVDLGLSATELFAHIQAGNIVAVKRGTDWFISAAEMNRFQTQPPLVAITRSLTPVCAAFEFPLALRRALKARGIIFTGGAILPDFAAAQPFVSGKRTYNLNDNGTSRVCSYEEVVALASGD